MSATASGEKVRWYRCKLSREDLAALNRRSDAMGLVWTLGFLAVLAATGSAAFWSFRHWPWPATVGLTLLHGACWNFLINGFHELVHDTVFRTKWLNRWFLRLFSFLGSYNHHAFWASHTEHHKFTLHPPDDLEVVLPQRFTLAGWLKSALVNPGYLRWNLQNTARIARGRLAGDWENHLFADDPAAKRALVRWARILLLGHGAIIAVSCWLHLWMLPVLITFAPYYGGGLHFLCNAAQHVGLRDRVADFRLCCRTIELNPLLRFLYWNMNYHIEHHMFAAVPCYRLGRLHRLIAAELPPTPKGLYRTWRGIAAILARQKAEPGYQFTAELPSGSGPVPIEPVAAAASTAAPTTLAAAG